jgi:hypothetical protein
VILIEKDKTQIDKAHETLKRASIILNRLPDTVFKDRPESESRQAWEKWIQDSETALKQLGF